MALDIFRDGFVSLCFDTSANIVDDKCRMVLEGISFDNGNGGYVQPDILHKITSMRDIDDMFGEGSVMAESLKIAVECCGNNAVDFYALPRAAAAGSVNAEYTLTFSGPATTSGRVDLFWGNSDWNISVLITSGLTDAQIATEIVNAVPQSFPYTASAAGGVVTLVSKNPGTAGNNLEVIYNWHGRNSYAPEGVAMVAAQTVVGSGDPAPLNYQVVFGECCLCCFAMLYEAPAWQDGAIAYLEDAWDCSKPQCFGHGYTYNSGTLGQITPNDTNSAVVSRLAHGTGSPILPWLKVAAYAGKSCCLTIDNPEISVQGPNFGLLECVSGPESCVDVFDLDDRQELMDAGFVVAIPASGGTGALTSPMITNDITNNRFDIEGRLNLTFQSVSSRRLATETARQITEQLQAFNGLGYYTRDTSIREGAQGTNAKQITGVMRSWVKSQIGVLFSEFDNLDTALTVTDDFETAPRCQGVPGSLNLNLTYAPPVRIRQFKVNATPVVLNNC